MLALFLPLLGCRAAVAGSAIHVVDDVTGVGVPCATLTTTNAIVFQADDDGWVDVDEPGLDGLRVWFTVEADGWVHAPDWIGFAGEDVTLDGTSVEIPMTATGVGGACGRGDIEARTAALGPPLPSDLFGVQVVDDVTGGGVPLVFVDDGERTWVTDNGGWVAWRDIDRMDADLTLSLRSDGYTSTAAEVHTTAGDATTIALHREQIAERLYRITGEGRWNDTLLLGLDAPVADPLLDGQVMGQDSSAVVEADGERFWLWGDTNRVWYPLGNYYTCTATSALADDPAVGLDLDYHVDADGFCKPSVDFTTGGPVWMGGLVAATDGGIYAGFDQVDGSWASVDGGMAVWNPADETWDRACTYTADSPAARPDGQVTVWDGVAYSYDGVRRIATGAGLCAFDDYEAWTPIVGDTVQTEDGVAAYAWRAGERLPVDGELDAGEGVLDGISDRDSGDAVTRHIGSIQWNAWLGRFASVFTQAYGTPSFLGESWFAVADTPVGPWGPAVKIITHDDYSFYNPHLEPGMDEDGGRVVYLEGTYASTFSGSDPTPRYDYNQVMYRLDLDDPAVAVPVAVYERGAALGTRAQVRADDGALATAFFAYGAPVAGATDLYWSGPDCGPRTLGETGPEYAFSVPSAGVSATVPLWECGDGDDVTWQVGGSATGCTDVGEVWPNPLTIRFSPGEFLPLTRADAGPDLCLTGTGDTLSVTLDGSGSVSPEGVLRWDWSWDGGSATGETADVVLPAGVTAVTLTITDGAGATAADVVLIGAPAPADDTAAGSGDDTGPAHADSGHGSDPDGNPAPDPADGAGCGCAASSSAAGWVPLLAGLVLAAWGPTLRRR